MPTIANITSTNHDHSELNNSVFLYFVMATIALLFCCSAICHLGLPGYCATRKKLKAPKPAEKAKRPVEITPLLDAQTRPIENTQLSADSLQNPSPANIPPH